jgi:hypothetical protein
MATNVWTGAINNDWNNRGNWSLGTVPMATDGDDIQIGDAITHPAITVEIIGRLQNTVINQGTITRAASHADGASSKIWRSSRRSDTMGRKLATWYFESTASASNQSRTMRGLALKVAGLAVALAASAIASAVPVVLPSLSGDPSGAGRSLPIVAALDSTEASAAFDNLASQGILSNQPSLRAPTTRGEFVLALQRMFNLPESKEATAFTDVPLNSPLGSALRAIGPYLGRQILCPGCALGTNFLPDQPISNLNAAFNHDPCAGRTKEIAVAHAH